MQNYSFITLFHKLRFRIKNILQRLKAYFRKLLFPLYLFPIKLFTYSLYYLVKLSIRFIVSVIRMIIDAVIYPFRGLRNFFKTILIIAVFLYMTASLFVITDYLNNQYGYAGKFFCSFGIRDQMQNSVVRIVGGYSEGSGFFITPNKVMTNFHVIADEPSPKIIFSDGTFVTPIEIVGNKDIDLAVLTTQKKYKDLVLPLPEEIELYDDEPLLAVGYPMGTDLSGPATILKGNFIEFRYPKYMGINVLQTNISLVEGMSGGPLVDQCGQVVGINTLGLAGLSLFINGDSALKSVPNLTDQNITKIDVDPSQSPEEAVKAFYTYLKARQMKKGFNLLSKEYLKKTNYKEWTDRFTDIIDVDVILTERYNGIQDTVFVKFTTKNWNNGEVDYHSFEGTWQTVWEDDVYKMLKSNIEEISDPGWEWFWE